MAPAPDETTAAPEDAGTIGGLAESGTQPLEPQPEAANAGPDSTEDRKQPIPSEVELAALSDDQLINQVLTHGGPMREIGGRSEALAWLNGERVRREAAVPQPNEPSAAKPASEDLVVNGHAEPFQTPEPVDDGLTQAQAERSGTQPLEPGHVSGAQVAAHI